MNKKTMISPSILASDFSNLNKAFEDMKNAGAEMAHIDVMDGVFVPNISIGIPVVKSLRPKSDLIFDVHLMIIDPIKYVKDFADAGADIITFHIESESDVSQTISEIKKTGKKVGIALKPKTPATAVFPYLEKVDMVLVMTVEPGFGGQEMIPETIDKVRIIREYANEKGLHALNIEVDGGINENNAHLAIEAGANVIVAGSAIFGSKTPSKVIRKIREAEQA